MEPFSAPQNYVANYPKELTHTHKLVLHFCGAWVYRQPETSPTRFEPGKFMFICFSYTDALASSFKAGQSRDFGDPYGNQK